MLRRMIALMALVSLMALAACSSVSGISEETQTAEQDSDRFDNEFTPGPDELVDGEEETGHGGGSGEDNRPNAHRDSGRDRGEVAP